MQQTTQTQAQGAAGPIPPIVLPVRACLQPLGSAAFATPAQEAQALAGLARHRSDSGAQTQLRLKQARLQARQDSVRLFLARVEWYTVVELIEQRQLHTALGHPSARSLMDALSSPWPGDPVSEAFHARLRLVARFLPDEMLYAELGTPNLKTELSRLRSPLCIQYLGGLLLDGEKTRLINIGRRAAWEALLPYQRRGPLPPEAEELALHEAVRAIREASRPRPRDPGGESRKTPREDDKPKVPAAGDTEEAAPGPPLKGLSPEPPLKGLSQDPDQVFSQQAARPYVEPPPPYADPLGEAVLPVRIHRSLLYQMTRAEHLGYRLLALGHSVVSLLSEWRRRRRQDFELTDIELQLLVYDQLAEARLLLPPFIRLLQPALGRARTTELDHPDEPIDLILEWVRHENADPLTLSDINPSEQLLITVLGQLPPLLLDLRALGELRQQGGEQAAIDLRLLQRLGELLEELEDRVLRASVQMSLCARQAHDARQAAAQVQAEIEAVQGPRASRIVVVGAEALPPAHGFVAKTLDDRLLAWNFWEPSFTFLLGDRGKGKSTLPRSIAQQTPHGLLPSLIPTSCPAYLCAAPR